MLRYITILLASSVTLALPAGERKGVQGGNSSGHGLFQARRMLSDRLQMNVTVTSKGEQVVLQETDVLVRWLVSRFDGAEIGMKVFWDPASPENGSGADHALPILGSAATIRVKPLEDRDGPAFLRFERLWFSTVFEMHNLENHRHFQRLFELAAQGLVDQAAFVEECARLEYKALGKTRAFYSNVWRKWAEQNGAISNKKVWDHGWRNTFEEWIRAQEQAGAGYPADVFRPLFDWSKSDYRKYLDQLKSSQR